MTILTARRFQQMGDIPTGPDGGAWLAIGRGMLGGVGRDAGGAYAPLVPAAIAATESVLGPVGAVWAVALVAWLALLLVLAWMTWHEAGWPAAIFVVLAVGSASTVAEPLYFGGYPQVAATAAAIAALWLLARWLREGNPVLLLGGAGALSVAAASHHVYGAVSVAACGVLWCVWRLTGRPTTGGGQAGAMPFALACAAAAAILLPTLLAFSREGYAPPLEATAYTPLEAWRYATREGTVAWSIAIVAGLAALWRWRARPSALWLVAATLYATIAPAFLLFPEPRLVPLLLVAATLALTIPLAVWSGPRVAATVVLAAVALAIRADPQAEAYARFYRVLDRSTIAAAAAISALDPSGLVAVRADRRGWPVGWWFEGLTEERIAVGSDPRWLGFPAERRRAATVAALFAPGVSAAAVRTLAGETGVELLVTDKWEWIGWDRWLAEPDPGVVVVYDDDRTLVLRLEPP